MSAERSISVEEGLKYSRTAASTVVRAKEGDGLWVSTVYLNCGSLITSPKMETLVFPIPSDVDLKRNPQGRVVDFTKSFPLDEGQAPAEVDPFNRTGMDSRQTALENHRGAVAVAQNVLATLKR